MKDSMLKIGQLARVAGVSADTLRYYERLGLLPAAERSAGRYRLYPASLAERVEFIRKAQALGLTLEQVREVLRIAADGTPPCEHVRARLDARLREINTRVRELESLRATLTAALRRGRARAAATPCLCEIIDAQPLARSSDGPAGRAKSMVVPGRARSPNRR